ncbi:MAG TPA: CPBP family intramembrane glutamic endopeptidase [Nitrospiraceae bacterium]|nr:CPBP family intramembrane glutamic endopeptidase [Nitrospiraceae bacterium]
MLDDPPCRRRIVLLAVLFEAGLGVLALAVGWAIHCPIWQSVQWNFNDGLFALAATVPLLLIFLACVRWPIGPLARIKTFAEEVLKPLFRSCTLLDLAAISLAAGFGEEALFRGILQSALSRWLALWLALTLASLLFGLLHWITPTYAVLATLIGAYLGWLFIDSGNLLVPILVHALYDFFALAFVAKDGDSLRTASGNPL